ncbi:MAG: UbiD family decarboxylase [Desulfurococcales archaeon]|nr:UbiD family decarboxylase [Desulfurococcales archaeon]
MRSASLSEYISRFQIERVERILSREYEPTRLILEKQGKGPILLFRVERAVQEVAANIIDTREKLYRALGVAGDEDAYRKLLEAMSNPAEIRVQGGDKLKEAPNGLHDLPVIKFYEGEGGYYISSGVFVACTNFCNASIHRIMVVGEREARVRIVPRHLWAMYRKAARAGKRLPVTIFMGSNPIVILAAALSPKMGVFELGIAARLLEGLEFAESPLHGNPVPRGVSTIIEGWLMPELADEGPYVDALMTYDRVRKQPVLKVEKVYYNQDEPTHVIVGGSLEHVILMGFPREAAIWESVSRVVPRVNKVRLTSPSGGWLHAVISIEKSHEGDGKNAIMAAFAGHPSLKHVVVVDSDIDPDNPELVEWAIATRFQADKDLILIRNARGSTLDPSSTNGVTAKMGLDATKPLDSGLEYERGRVP